MRLKTDAAALLHAFRAGAACPEFISPGRRLSITKQLEQLGLLRDGKLTAHGERVAGSIQPPHATAEPVQQSEAMPDATDEPE